MFHWASWRELDKTGPPTFLLRKSSINIGDIGEYFLQFHVHVEDLGHLGYLPEEKLTWNLKKIKRFIFQKLPGLVNNSSCHRFSDVFFGGGGGNTWNINGMKCSFQALPMALALAPTVWVLPAAYRMIFQNSMRQLNWKGKIWDRSCLAMGQVPYFLGNRN